MLKYRINRKAVARGIAAGEPKTVDIHISVIKAGNNIEISIATSIGNTESKFERAVENIFIRILNSSADMQ
jgi:hypothetical protein